MTTPWHAFRGVWGTHGRSLVIQELNGMIRCFQKYRAYEREYTAWLIISLWFDLLDSKATEKIIGAFAAKCLNQSTVIFKHTRRDYDDYKIKPVLFWDHPSCLPWPWMWSFVALQIDLPLRCHLYEICSNFSKQRQLASSCTNPGS